MKNMKTQEELLEELLDEVRQTRRYAEAMHQSSTRIIDIVSTVFDTQGVDITGVAMDARNKAYSTESPVGTMQQDLENVYREDPSTEEQL